MPAKLVALGAMATATSTNAQAQVGVLEEIVITASRREESIQDAPAVVNVLGELEIERFRINDLDSISQLTPGLVLDGNHNHSQRIALRGAFINNDRPGNSGSVGLYIDGVFFGRAASLSPVMHDVERIEVLKGPQGTLFGPNVTGGLIHIQTRNPSTSDIEGTAWVTGGNFGRLDLGGRVSVPLIEDELGISVSVLNQTSDGWQRNLLTGRDLDADDMQSIRLKTLWTPNDRASVKGMFEYLNDESFGVSRGYFSERSTTSPSLWAGSFPYPGDDWQETYQLNDVSQDRDLYTAALDVNFDLSESMSLTGILTYHSNQSSSVNNTFIPSPFSDINISPVKDLRTFTQEIRLAGETDRVTWQTGVYYLNESDSQVNTYTQVISPASAAGAVGIFRSGVNVVDITVNTDSYSGFGQVTFAATDWLDLTAGIRYSYVQKDSIDSRSGDFGNGIFFQEDPTPYAVTNLGDWDRATPRFTAELHWEDIAMFDQVMLWGTYSEGFKDGAIFSGTTIVESTGVFGAEVAKNREGGFKTTFWDGKANFNASYFSTDYDNLQTLVFVDGGTAVALVSDDAEVEGIDLGISLAPADGLTLQLDYTWMDSEILSGTNVGNELARTPETGYTLMGNYNWSAGPWTFNIDASFAYTDPSFIDNSNELAAGPEIFELTEIERLDLTLSAAYGDHWEVSFWGKNLLDDKIVTEANPFSTFTNLTPGEAFGAGLELWAGRTDQPLTYGVTVKYSLR